MNCGAFLPCHDSKNVKAHCSRKTADCRCLCQVPDRKHQQPCPLIAAQALKSLPFTLASSTARGAGELNERRTTNLLHDNIWLQRSEEDKQGWFCWKAAAKSQLCPAGEGEGQNWQRDGDLSCRGKQRVEISLTRDGTDGKTRRIKDVAWKVWGLR